MKRLLALARDESGVALASVVLLGSAMTLLSVLLIDSVRTEGDQAVRASKGTASLQAAEAGAEDYIAKLVDDRQYYLHYVHPGEGTRRTTAGVLVSAGNPWTGGTTWTYPNGKDTWRQLGNGYEYSLQITAPGAGQVGVRIFSTGRKVGSTTEQKAIEMLVRPSSVADYFMLTNSDYSVGSAATTYGKIYAGIDDSGVRHSVDHDGVAYGNIYAENQATGSATMMSGAQKYDIDSSPDIRSQIKNPISFNNFLASFTDIQSAAQFGGIYLNNAAVHGWKLTFLSNGTVRAERCTRNGTNHLAQATPTCNTPVVYNVPVNGAIYVEQSAIVIGQVNGRVTVASNQDIVVPGDISYVTSGDDVLGLIAKTDVIIAKWAPTTVNWRASVIAQTGRRRSWDSSGSHNTATFTGSVASNLSPYMDMFDTRVYNYDPELEYLPPPWFPIVEDAYTVLLYREIAP